MEKLPTVLIPAIVLQTDSAARSQLFAQTLRPIGQHSQPPKGYSESQFEHDLWRYFPGKIHSGLLVKNPELQQPFVPDFAYIDSALNLHLDIEIDEPYTHGSRQPLHYVGCRKDEQRNQFFLNSGWVVVRFSELQVVKSPASCCKTIASTIATLTGDSALMTAFRPVPTLKPERRWTVAEAQKMAAVGFRDRYLVNSSETPQRKNQTTSKPSRVLTSRFTFYCPECGEGPIRWQGHYIQCPNCGCDGFAW